MAKDFFQDMIKMKSDLRKETKGLKETSLPKIKITREEKKEEKFKEEVLLPQIEKKPVRQSEQISRTDVPRRRPRYSLWFVAAAAVVFLFFAVSYFFARASITINPKTEDITYNQNLSAIKGDTSPDGLSFDVISLSGDETRTVQGGQVADASVTAKGTVVIYNNFSAASQRLDINTRLEGSNGKMYKTVKAVVVPGLKGTTPGSVEVGIYANEAGDTYNSGPLDFQIFGFKGTPKYSKFYARSKGDITGGLIGKVSTITDDKKAQIVNDMKATLEAKLLTKATGLIPAGFVLFKDSIMLNVDSSNFDFSGGGDQIPVDVKGTFYGFILNEKELTKKIVTATITDYDGSDVYISNMSDLTFTFLDQSGPAISDIQTINFNLSGNPKVVWRFDVDKLVTSLAGQSKSSFNQILSTYPNVVAADVVLSPVWRRSFPSDKNNIKVLVNYPK